jgi:CDP-glycerol glycerophosphotransferase
VQRNENRHKIIYRAVTWLQQKSLWRKFLVYPGGWGDFYLLSPNKLSDKQFSESFSYVPSNRFIPSTYPRVHLNSVFLKEEVNILETITKYNKIILYMPTFRLGKQSLQFAELGESLKDILQKENILWIQKAHSADSTSKELKSENNILSLSPNFETNILMPYITLLITDYSSVATDARYFNKPILFYIPDYEEYKNGENGLTDEAEELMSGPKFYNTESLRNQIVSLISNPNQAIPHNYTELRNKCWNPDFDISDVWEKISKLK